MTTNLDVNLSTQLQTTLDHQGVFAYAVYFDTNGNNPVWTTIVDGTTATPTVHASTSIAMPDPYVSGKVYFLVQSLAPGANSTLQTDITTESQINWGNAAAPANDFRYDSFELNLSSSPTDVGNLTSVNGFGIPMSVTVGTDTRGYDIGGTTLFNDVIGISAAGTQDFTYATGTALAGQQRMVLSAAESVGGGYTAFQASDWSNYVTSLEATASNIVVSGYFNGAPTGPPGAQVWHDAGFYSYQLSYDGTDFWLSPQANSEIKGYIQISPDQLENSIYSTLGTANVYASMSDATNGVGPYLASMNTGTNNQWGEVFTQLLTGFTAGYYGAMGNALNPTALATPLSSVDLSKTWNWDPTYAFGSNGTAPASVHYDQYAKLFFDHSNSYGSGYSDNLMSAFPAGGPLISLWDSSTNAEAASIGITLYADGETPAGYVQPVMYNYLAGGYAEPAPPTGNALTVSLSLANASMMVQDQTPVSIAFYNGGTTGTFTTLSLPTGQSIFQNWNIDYDTGSQTYSLSSFGSNVPGSILFNKLPVAPADDIAWYQITVGSGTAAKTFNLYAKTDSSGQHFLNPAYTGQATDLQVDGLALVTPPAHNPVLQTIDTFTVDLFNGLPASLLTRITDQTIIDNPGNGSFPTPDAPVVGTLSGGVFTQASSSTVATGGLAFGWYGADSVAVTNTPAYTNKIGALNVAQVAFSGTHSHLTPGTDTADLDGNWMMAIPASFGNGSYTATMTEYLASDVTFSTPLEKASTPLNFTVQLSSLLLDANGQGDGLQLHADGSGTGGNWIQLETTHSTLPNGTLLAYATDASGHLVGRDGSTGSGVTLDDAVLARIGAVASDSGAVLFSGKQSVYLPVDQQLHFAILSGNEIIEQTPGVNITGSGSLAVTVSGSHGALQLNATVDNTLSANAELAGGQRTSDQAWVYLTKGSTVNVEIAGSASNVNTAHFVHIDVDQATGGWSVAGVAYGNTDAFRTAVQQHWDGGFNVQNGGGTFHGDVNWNVAGGSGFYAPVLATQSGDIFVVGNANVDGHAHIRSYGENVFGFEDLRADQHSDFDYNDMVMKLTVT